MGARRSMGWGNWRLWSAAAVGGVGLMVAGVLYAQDAEPDAPDEPPARMSPMVESGAAGIAASGGFVHVLRGNTVYQLRADGLNYVTRRTLPPERRTIEEDGRDRPRDDQDNRGDQGAP